MYTNSKTELQFIKLSEPFWAYHNFYYVLMHKKQKIQLRSVLN